MTRTEALACLRRMASIWPGADIPDATMELWLDELADVSQPQAVEAVRILARSERWWPSFAVWTHALAGVREQARYRPARPELDERVPTNTEQKAHLAGVRAALHPRMDVCDG